MVPHSLTLLLSSSLRSLTYRRGWAVIPVLILCHYMRAQNITSALFILFSICELNITLKIFLLFSYRRLNITYYHMRTFSFRYRISNENLLFSLGTEYHLGTFELLLLFSVIKNHTTYVEFTGICKWTKYR